MSALRQIDGPHADLIELSDLFRRAVHFEQQDAVARIVHMTRQLGCVISNLRPEYDMGHWVNKQYLEEAKIILEDLDIVASAVGLTGLTLPLHQDDPFASILQESVLDAGTYEISFTFRDSDYDLDLDGVGYIREETKTFLDVGLRGLGAIDSELKYKWDSDVRSGGQYNLGL